MFGRLHTHTYHKIINKLKKGGTQSVFNLMFLPRLSPQLASEWIEISVIAVVICVMDACLAEGDRNVRETKV